MTAVIDKKFTSLSYFDAVALNDKFAALDAVQLSYGTTPLAATVSGGDSVQLPPAVANSRVEVFISEGQSSNNVAIFAKNGTSDTINGHPNNTQFDCVSTNTVAGLNTTIPFVFVCAVDGAWFGNVTVD